MESVHEWRAGGRGSNLATVWQRATEWGDLGAEVAEMLDQIESLKLR